jgi:hypothetical protein
VSFAGKTTGGTPIATTTVITSATSYSASGLPAGAYSLTVQSANGTAFSAKTPPGTANLAALPITLNAPTSPSATVGTTGNVAVAWSPSPFATMYHLHVRGTTAAGPVASVIVGISGTSKAVAGLAPGTYVFRVAAANSTSLSSWSYQTSEVVVAAR